MKRILLGVAIFSITLSSCHDGWFGHRIRGNGNVVTETRDIKNFDAIDVSAGIDVYVKQEPSESVKVETDANIQEYIITEVKDGVLYIHPASNTSLNTTGEIKVYVSAKNFKRFEASSAADIIGESKILSDSEIFIKASSSADVQLDIKSPKLSSDISSGASVNLTGETKDFSVEASSGSSAKCFELMSENTKVQVSSGANADVFASVNISGKASSGGSIDYKGNAASIVETSSGGTVSKAN